MNINEFCWHICMESQKEGLSEPELMTCLIMTYLQIFKVNNSSYKDLEKSFSVHLNMYKEMLEIDK